MNLSSNRDNHHPEPIRDSEQALLAARRAAAGVAPDQLPFGVAVSGGGIRSAIFALGFFQGITGGDGRTQNLLPRIDWLSTVSGGGYFGSFLGRLFQACGSHTEVRKELLDPHSGPIEHLRRNGRYLAPGGRDDGWLAFAYALRSLLAMQLLFVLLAYTVGLLVLLLSPALHPLADTFSLPTLPVNWLAIIERHAGPWWSLTVIPIAAFLLLAVAYYIYGLIAAGGEEARIAQPWRAMIIADDEVLRRRRYCMTLWQARALTVLVLLLGIGLLQGLADILLRPSVRKMFLDEFMLWFGAAVVVAEGMLLFGKRLMAMMIGDGSSGKGGSAFKLPLTVAGAAAGAVVLFALALLGFTLATAMLLQLDARWPSYANLQWPDIFCLLAQFALLFLLGCWVSLVNSTSLHPFYYARLARTFLSAVNYNSRDAIRAASCGAGGAIPGDTPLKDYQPDLAGGPLHVINCTINETVEPDSKLWRSDRKGVNLAVSHWLFSVGARHHLLRQNNDWTPYGPILPTEKPTHPGETIEGRKLFTDCGGHEELTVGRWVGISGAAFSTGLGSLTNWWSSVVCAVANVRLGYWWRTRKLPFWSYYCPRLYRYMVQELFGFFRGTSAPYWYLSDGGHFENMGAYELIRRRVPAIVILDAECDPDYQYQGFGNLVHKARMDFGCEIRAFDDFERKARFSESPQLVSLAGLRGEWKDGLRKNGGRAVLAGGWFSDNGEHLRDPDIWILYVKPAMCGDEAVDVQHYRSENPEFPQQTTMDQFFDEVQWECYRKLGEQTGIQLCGVIEELIASPN